jgi:hypothetical protein
MAIMQAKLISTEGAYLPAILEIEGERYCVMDEFTVDPRSMPKVGETFDFEFSNMLDEDESWEFIFQSNPDKKICIEKIEGWKYSAYGKIVEINPVRVDWGVFIEENVIHTHDEKVIGEFVGFTMTRLGGYAI